ncbi:unnamed protein product [Rhizopus microsporus]
MTAVGPLPPFPLSSFSLSVFLLPLVIMLSTFLKSSRFVNSARSFSSSRLCYSVYAQHNEDAPMHALQARLGLASIIQMLSRKH